MSEPSVATSPLAHSRRARFWLRELPYIAVLTLNNIGRGLYRRVRASLSSAIGSFLP
jgi:hypothetical protein